jgi:glycosyltransferase involved in cell wall biosynthesis
MRLVTSRPKPELRRAFNEQHGLRILMISGLDIREFYGTSTRPYYVGKVLSRMGVKVLHVCPFPPRRRVAYMSFVPVGSRKFLFGKIASLIRVCGLALLFRPDAIYAHQVWNALPIRYLASFLRKPLVLDLHGSPTQELSSTGTASSDLLALTEQAERNAISAADKLIVVSSELGDFIRSKFGVPAEKLVLIPNGVDLRSYAKEVSTDELQKAKTALKIPSGNRVVVFTCPRIELFPSNESALRWFFRVIPMVESKRRDVTFLILGGGKIIRAPSTSVVYSGFVENLPVALAASDVCVLPYPPNAICGGVRNKALEYFAAAKPVVSTSEGMRGIGEAAPGREYLLANSVDDFAAKIIDLLSDEALTRKIASNGLAIARRYDWSLMGQRVYGALQSYAVLDRKM